MYRVYVYTPVGICVHEASWNPWKRGSGDRPGPPQCQKSAMKKITWSRGTRIDAVSELGIVFVSSMYRSLITIQYPRCIECVSKWYRKTIQYRSPDGAKNVSCLYRKCIEQKVSRYCIEREISKITIHIRYTSIQFDTVRYIYRENAPRYIGKKAPFPGRQL